MLYLVLLDKCFSFFCKSCQARGRTDRERQRKKKRGRVEKCINNSCFLDFDVVGHSEGVTELWSALFSVCTPLIPVCGFHVYMGHALVSRSETRGISH